MILIFEILLAGYLFCRLILPLRLHWGWKAALGLPLALAAFKLHLFRLLGGPRFFAPELPAAVQLAGAWMFATVFMLFFLVLAADVARGLAVLAGRLAGRKPGDGFRRVNRWINPGLVLAAMVLATAGTVGGRALPRVREVTLTTGKLPREYDGLTVAVLADLHADTLNRGGRIREIVERTNALHPDVVALVGDFVDGPVALRGGDLAPLAGLSARYGVYGVPGNHEYYSGYSEWMAFLEELGIVMLPNAYRLLPGGRVAVAGVTDPNAARFGGEAPDPVRALDGIPPGVLTILLAHQPKLAREAARAGADVQLSGHTHGGLIAGFDRLVARFNDGFVAGLYRVGDLQLYVSRGAGIWNGFPIRVGVPPEITLLRLRSADPAP